MAILIRFDGAELPKTLAGIIVGMVIIPVAPIAVFFKKDLRVDFIGYRFSY